MNIVYRSFESNPQCVAKPMSVRYLRHPLLAWLHLRPLIAEHTRAEDEALGRWARDRKTLVEIGVAEGASGLALRNAMHPDGTLYLVDPFHLSRFPLLNSMKRVARSTLNRSRNGRVVWIERFSCDAAKSWTTPIEFVFLDGDHAVSAVRQDWKDWHAHVPVGGVVAFHDARLFTGGWTTSSDGPVRLVDELFRSRRARSWDIVEEVDSLVVVRRWA